jgi:hypothetical protein
MESAFSHVVTAAVLAMGQRKELEGSSEFGMQRSGRCWRLVGSVGDGSVGLGSWNCLQLIDSIYS